MSFEFFLVYSVTVFVASIVPGPSMLLALTHGMKYGTKRGQRHLRWAIWWSRCFRRPENSCFLSRASVGKYFNKVIGGTFIGAGIGLAVSRK